MTFNYENEIIDKFESLSWLQPIVEQLIMQKITSILSASNELYEGDYIDRVSLISSYNPGKVCIVYYHNSKNMHSFAPTTYKEEFLFSELINFIS
jgi:hypothetical protein